MPAWLITATAVVFLFAFMAALGMWVVAEQQNARLRRALNSRRPQQASNP